MPRAMHAAGPGWPLLALQDHLGDGPAGGSELGAVGAAGDGSGEDRVDAGRQDDRHHGGLAGWRVADRDRDDPDLAEVDDDVARVITVATDLGGGQH